MSSYYIPIISLAILLILGLYCCTLISAEQPVTNDDGLGGLDLYKISWKGPPTDQDKEYAERDDDNVIHISTKDNEKYMCIVPGNVNLNFDSSAKNSSTTSTAEDQESDKNKSPIKILEPLLKGNFCSYKFEVFWIYELCHGKYLRQYHEEKAKYKTLVTQEYYLGKMESEQIQAHDEEYQRQREIEARTGEPRPKILVNGHYKPYVTFNMTSGTKCDLTKKSRLSRIIYVCNDEPSIELYSIKEISTCEYEAIVLLPMLCQHEDFKIDTTTQREIKCYSLDGSPLRPKKTIEYEDDSVDENDSSADKRNGQKRLSKVYFKGFGTIFIDTDKIFN